MRSLTEEQRVAASTLDSAVALTAAAGSGKTTVLVERFLNLLSRGVPPRAILTVTFTNEAADQLKERIAHALTRTEASEDVRESVALSPYIGTLHSFCYRVLDQYGSVIGLNAIESILSPFEFSVAFDELYTDWLETLASEKEASLAALLQYYSRRELRELVQSLFSQRSILPELKEGLEADEAEVWNLITESTRPLFQSLSSRFSERGVYSFDELEQLTLEIFKHAPSVADRLQKQFQSICVDEFQDTSQAQWEILRKIIGTELHKLFVVGDPKQSIYRFRNADVRVFYHAAEEMVRQGGKLLELTANFRSQPEIIDQINRLASLFFEGSPIPFSPMSSGREAPPKAKTTRFQIIRYPGAKTDWAREEIKEVVRHVKSLMAEGASPGEIALLFRVSDRIPAFFEALAEESVPVAAKKTGQLFQSYDVLDLMAYLKAVHNPLDDYAFAGFLRSQYINLSLEQLFQLSQKEGQTLFEKTFGQSLPELGWFFSLIEKGTFEVSSALGELFQNTKKFPVNRELFLQLIEPLWEPNLLIPDAIAKLECWKKEGLSVSLKSKNTDGPAVSLMTVHGAKGLEYPYVLLVDNLRQSPRRSPPLRLSRGELPGLRYRKDGEMTPSKIYEALSESASTEEAHESKRILYVALTRAKERLQIFLPQDLKGLPKNSWGALLQAALG